MLAHKLREAVANGAADEQASGHVEVDGLLHRRPCAVRQTGKKIEIDRRLAENQTGKRRVVAVMRERNGKTLPFVVPSEDAAVPTIKARVANGSTIYADEAAHWDALHGKFIRRSGSITSVEYSDGDTSTNQAESFFEPVAPRGDWHPPPHSRSLSQFLCERDGVARGQQAREQR